MKLLIFGGTTEGRVLVRRLAEAGAQVTVSVATPMGAEELAGIPNLTVLTGRRDAAAMQALLQEFDLCIDATHPYAAEASANIRTACTAAGVPLRRAARPASAAAEPAFAADTTAEAAAFLAGTEGNILLTTGAKELPAFAGIDKTRLFARVLPTHEGISACEALGIPHRNIIAMQGPFGTALNCALMEQYHIAWLVTKDGGRAGGFAEKLEAARRTGAKVVLIRRPADVGEDPQQLLQQLLAALADQNPERRTSQ